MSEALRPFQKDATCPKCGHGSVNSTYHGRSRRCSYGCLGFFPGNSPEHIVRTCQGCLCEWLEAPLDATPSLEKS